MDHTEPDATVYTDDARACRGLARDHQVVKHSAGQYVDGDTHTNGMESHWAMLKRGIMGTYHHVSAKHLDWYATEFNGRHNFRPAEPIDQMAHMARRAGGKQDWSLRWTHSTKPWSFSPFTSRSLEPGFPRRCRALGESSGPDIHLVLLADVANVRVQYLRPEHRVPGGAPSCRSAVARRSAH